MIAHLDDQELADWLAGEGSNGAREHLYACAICRQELQSLEATLRRFREAVHAAAQLPRPLPTPATARRHWQAQFAAAALLLLAGALWWSAPTPQPRPTIVVQQDADDLLLREIDADVQRSVPEALEPVTVIVAARDRMALAQISGKENQ